MKFTLAALSAILAFSGVSDAAGWGCNHRSGGNNADKKRAVEDFDRLFGTRVLKAAPQQCYTSMCRGYSFSFCNLAGTTRSEKSGQRNQAKNKGLARNSGSQCKIYGLDNAIQYGYHQYKFSKISDMKECETKPRCGLSTNDIRKC